MSGSIISSAAYFLWRITTFPEIGNLDATLIGVSITCACFLCGYGILSGKGNPIESSLLVFTFGGTEEKLQLSTLSKKLTGVSFRILCSASIKCTDPPLPPSE